MRYQSVIPPLILALLAPVSQLVAQPDEIRLDPVQTKITTVSSMRARKTPEVKGEEIRRLKLGTVVTAIARSTNQDTISGKTDYWYRVNLSNGETGWLFGGLLLDYNVRQRHDLLRQIIEARLKVESTDFGDRGEIYDLAASAISEVKEVNTRAEFELLKLLALANWGASFPYPSPNKSPYREWLKAHAAEVIENEFAGGYNLRNDLLWNLEKKYHTLPIADRIAWEAVLNPLPSDCEDDEVCAFFRGADQITYLELHPNGAHAAEAVKNLTDDLTDEVIKAANDKGGDQYAVEQRTDLKKRLSSLRLALAKVSTHEKSELLKKLEKVTP